MWNVSCVDDREYMRVEDDCMSEIDYCNSPYS
jgi:hypothetical protein